MEFRLRLVYFYSRGVFLWIHLCFLFNISLRNKNYNIMNDYYTFLLLHINIFADMNKHYNNTI